MAEEKKPLIPHHDVEGAPPEGGKRPSGLQVGAALQVGGTAFVIIYYALCSSSMLVINKVAIYYVPAPIFVLFCQLFTSAIVVKAAETMKLLQSDALETEKVKKFMWVIVAFLGTLFANIKVLQNANVETFITFRSSTPLVLSVLDYLFLGRAMPNVRSWLCLVVLLMAALGYVMVDADFKVSAYIWLALWYIFFTFDAVYVKFVCDTVKMTNWGRVYYTNLLSLFPLILIFPTLGEQTVLANLEWNFSRILPLVLACLTGVGMSHASYLLREKVSATMFTIVGILCKVITVVINCLIWDKHASAQGIGFLMICLLAGTFYQQAPKRAEVKANAT